MKKILAAAVSAVLSFSTVSAYSTTADEYGCTEDYAGIYTTYDVDSYLNIRAGHSTSSSLLGQITAGAEFTVTQGNGSWAHVEYNGISGYASMDYMQKISDIEMLSGDLNRDGSVTYDDAEILQNYLLGITQITEYQYSIADINSDTNVDVFDMVLMRQILTAPPKEEPKPISVMYAVPEYCQHPDYPTGCESAALYMLLKYYGVDVTMEQIVTQLPKGPLPYWYNSTLYGANPEREFVGDPHSSYSYGVFNKPLAQTAEMFRSGVKTQTGVPLSDVMAILDAGSPVVAWYTTNPDRDIYYADSWYDYQTGEYISWPAGEHAVVICGHDETNLTYRDPNTGSSRTMSQEQFRIVYNQLGARILYYEN